MNERIFSKGADRLRSSERLERMEIDKVLKLCLEDKNIKSILDIGTGTGLFAETFYKKGLRVSGVDINEDFLREAAMHIPEAEFIKSAAESLPYTDKKFDATFFGVVFHEVDNYKKALSEAFRVTKDYTFILEWQYKKEEMGPPIEHRVKPEFVIDLAEKIGYIEIKSFKLKQLILFILKKS